MKRFFEILFFSVALVAPGVLRSQVLTGAHDPTVIKDDRCVYSLLTTNNLLQIRQSTDEVNWKVVGNIFTAVPAWVNTALGATIADIWAPCIRYNNGLYWVYYACSSFGTNNSVIGVASNPTLDTTSANYKWTDHGLVIQSGSANNYNCIDPDMVIDSTNNVWMLFGSFWSGIKMIAIDPSTGKQLAANTTIYSLASRGGGAIEGAALLQHGGYNYLFTSWDTCCQGVSSTYNTRVGRSASVTGPYADEAGTPLMNSGGTELLSSYAQYIGPGGGEAFQDGRRSYFAHHYYDANHAGNPYLQIREIIFDNNGWCDITQPYLGRHEAFEAEHAHLANVAVSQTASASNGDYVTGITAAGSQVVFYVNALAAGNYEASLRYANTGTAASQLLTVNGNPSIAVAYPSTGATLQFSPNQAVTVSVTLVEGYNVLSFQPQTGSVALDRMDLIRLAGDVTAAGSDDHDCSLTYQASNNSAIFSPGGDAQYENLDFKTGGYTTLSVYFSGACTGPLTFTLDSLGGTLAASANVTVSGPQTLTLALPTSFKNITGVHDLFAQFTGTGSCALGSFQFAAQLATATPTPTRTSTPTATRTSTGTPTKTTTSTFSVTKTNTPSATPTPTFTVTKTNSPTGTPTFSTTPTRTYTSTASATNTPANTATFTSTVTSTFTKTNTPSGTPTATATATPTKTNTPANTVTFTSTVTSTATKTNTSANTSTRTSTPTLSPTGTSTATATASFTPTATSQFTLTDTLSPTPSSSRTPTASATNTSTPTVTASNTNTPMNTSTSTATSTSTFTNTPMFTSTPTWSPTASSTLSFTATFTSTPTNTATLSPTPVFTSTFTPTSTPTFTFTFSPTTTSTFTNTPTQTMTPTITVTPTFTVGSTVPVLYPNPVSGPTVTIYVPGVTGNVTVQVFTTAFRMVESQGPEVLSASGTVTLDLAAGGTTVLANGLYYAVVTTSKARTVLKLIVLK